MSAPIHCPEAGWTACHEGAMATGAGVEERRGGGLLLALKRV